LYEPRGDFQLAVETLRHAGIGALYEAYARLKARLQAAGLFDAARKRPLPSHPSCIGIVTSPQAAALRDVLVALARRAPHLPVILYPAPVQGEGAGAQLAAALRLAAARGECDVLILCRGGGGIEDLWAFNDEALAHAIAASPVPVVTGIGHETDSTIADFVADLRAATPTAAAELVSGAWVAARQRLAQLAPQLAGAVRRRLLELAQRGDLAARRLVHPRERIRRLARELDGLRGRLVAAMRRRLEQADGRRERLALRLAGARPRPGALTVRLHALSLRLAALRRRMLAERGERLTTLEVHLRHLDPGRTLERGYAIVRDAGGALVRDAWRLQAGGAIRIRFARGGAQARVTHVDRTAPIVSPPLPD
jgi:exodeoxyribonuclease VII large subunit